MTNDRTPSATLSCCFLLRRSKHLLQRRAEKIHRLIWRHGGEASRPRFDMQMDKSECLKVRIAVRREDEVCLQASLSDSLDFCYLVAGLTGGKEILVAALSIKIDTDAVSKALAAYSRQIPFAISTALNSLGYQVQNAENAAMLTTFKNPRPFTGRSVLFPAAYRASKTKLSATVFVRPEVAKYLLPYENGGVHVLPGTANLIPVDIRLDQYGQLPRTTMALLRARKDIYIGPVKTRSGVITGVWQRVAISRAGNARRKRLGGGTVYDANQGALKLLIRFGNAVAVTQQLNFHRRGLALIASNAMAAFAKAIERVRATSR